MHALILTDELFASRERGLLERLEVGLADEGVRVIHAVPDAAGPMLSPSVYSRTLTYTPRTLPFTRGLALARLKRELEDFTQPMGEKIDVVHVFGGGAWGLGAALAKELDAALVLEVWRTGLVGRAREMELSHGRTLFLAPDPHIERALGGGVDTRPVRLAPWGALAEPGLRPILVEGQAPTAMIVGSGRDVPAFTAALTGLAEVARVRPDLLIFCDAVAARRAGLWALGRRLGLLSQLSLIDELESRRDLLLQGDLLIQPDANGEARSVLLEAMATGSLVIAAADPRVSVLIDARTARLVPSGDAAAWARTLREVLSDPVRARALAGSAQEYVRTHRRASDHVRAVLAAYEAAGVGAKRVGA